MIFLYIIALFLAGIWCLTISPKEHGVRRGSIFTMVKVLKNMKGTLQRWESEGVKVAKITLNPFSNTPLVIVLDADIASAILRNPEEFPQNPKSLAIGEVAEMFAANIVHLSGDAWKEKRRPLESLFSSEKIKDYSKVAKQQFEELLKVAGQSQKEVNFSISKGYVLRVLGKAIFDYTFPDFDGAKFSDHEILAQESAKLRTLLTEALGMFQSDKLHSSMRNLRNFVNKLVLKNGQSDGNNSIIALMASGNYSDSEVLANVLLFLIAGHTTTGKKSSMLAALLTLTSLIIWTLFEIAKHPQCYSQYSLSSIFAEVQRIHPIPEAISSRISKHNNNLNGITFASQSPIVIPLNFLHNNKRWENPDNFNPGRKFSGFFQPFGPPQRQCIGRTFALAVASTFVTCVMDQFSLSTPVKYLKEVSEIVIVLENKLV